MKLSLKIIFPVVAVLLVATIVAVIFYLRAGPQPPPVAAKPSGPAWFEDATLPLGLKFVHNAGPAGSYFMPQSMGSGVALIDYDQDGLLDLYLVQGAGPDSKHTNRLLQQQPDGAFRDVSQGSNLDIASWGTGVAAGDINNDGWPDLLLTQYGGLRLLLNEKGSGRFQDITRTAGLASLQWGASAAFFDYDRDGWLDIVITNYVALDPAKICYDDAGRRDFCAPELFRGATDTLYHNLGKEQIEFEDVTEKAGLSGQHSPGLGVLCGDFNRDGWPDIFIANDGQANHLWINQQNGSFRNEAYARGLAFNGTGQPEADMGVTRGDVDGDGMFDLFATHLNMETHTLWRQVEPGSFQDATARSGLSTTAARSTGFGAVLADFDLDGYLDLAFVSGHVRRDQSLNQQALGQFWSRYAGKNRLFANDGNGRMTDVSNNNPDFCAEPFVGRSLACGDLDNDGDLDLVTLGAASPAKIYRNTAAAKGHWLIVRAVIPELKRDATGAEVTVVTGSNRWRRYNDPGYSYQCSNDPRAHFGLGDAATFDRIDIRWPDGSEEKFPGGDADQILVLEKGMGAP